MKIKILIITVFFLSLSKQAFCGGTEFSSFFGSKTMSLNNMYFAGVDGLNLTIKNPSGLAFLTENMVGISLIDQMGQHEFISGDLVHRTFRNDDFSFGGGIIWRFSEQLTAALSYAPVTDYRVDWPFLSQRSNDSLNLIFSFNMFNRIQINSITPSVAMRFGSFAAGVSANIYMVSFNTAFPVENTQWSAGRGLASYQQDYKMDTWAYGFTLGLMADITDNLRAGASVKSGFSSSPEGEATSRMFSDLDSVSGTVNINTDLEMPWRFGVGLAYSLIPDLIINADAEYSLWESTSDRIDFEFDNIALHNRLSDENIIYGIRGNSFSFKNDNSLKAGIGIEYYALDYLAVRGGYRYTQTPNSSENYNFLFPDVSTHSLSIGLGLKEENITIDGAIIYSFGVEEEVQKNYSHLSGKYNLDNIIPSVTISYKF